MSSRGQDERFMAECIELARKGKGYVNPNPLVGAILVKNGVVIGRGYHRRFGGAHAEIEAIRRAKRNVAGSTLYVNLEPCVHYGKKKTPPCTNAIISNRIRRVVIGTIDPNPPVRGKGVRALKSAGIKVRVGVLQDECRRLNEFFFKSVTTGLPFVALKIAQTIDGKIARVDGGSRWITSRESRKHVHQLRAEYDAVLVGARTIALDDPRLTVRYLKGRNPKRVVLDGKLSSPLSSHVFTDSLSSRTILFCGKELDQSQTRKKEILRRRGVQVVDVAANANGRINLRQALKRLARMGVNSVLVEGGQQIFTEFLWAKLVDKAYVFVAPKVFGFKGLPVLGDLPFKGEPPKFTSLELKRTGTDILIEGYYRRWS